MTRVHLAYRAALSAHLRAAALHESAAELFMRRGHVESAMRELDFAERERVRYEAAVEAHPEWA